MIIHRTDGDGTCFRYTGRQFIMLKRIPIGIMDEVVRHFRKDLEREAVVQIRWDDGYRIVYPMKQEASRTSVLYSFGVMKGELAVTIHSHNAMSAFWSETDDADELFMPGIYGVFGRLDRRIPECRFRYCSGNGEAVLLDIWDICCI